MIASEHCAELSWLYHHQNHITPISQQPHWLPIKYQVTFRILWKYNTFQAKLHQLKPKFSFIILTHTLSPTFFIYGL